MPDVRPDNPAGPEAGVAWATNRQQPRRQPRDRLPNNQPRCRWTGISSYWLLGSFTPPLANAALTAPVAAGPTGAFRGFGARRRVA